ncbi:unnamed protein product [Lathyrus sativus]|nr:unnamed protein product [Lathyrus sativus]
MNRKKKSFHKSPFFLSKIKRKKTCIKSEPQFYLPDECWEHVFKFIINGDDGETEKVKFIINGDDGETEKKHRVLFKSLSLVSKQFLSITDRLIFSISISDHPSHLLPRVFHRFPNLNSLHLCFGLRHLDSTIALALRDRTTLKSLSISNIELKDANCDTSHYIDSFGIQHLDLRQAGIQHLEHQADFLKNHHIALISLFLGGLVSIKLSYCFNLTKSALFALVRNCHSLAEITMERSGIGRQRVESSNSLKDFEVYPQLKFLCLAHNSFIKNNDIILFASIFPNLQYLDLSHCYSITEKIPQLEVLNLSDTSIDDKTLQCHGKGKRQ